jgi:hypothetical protein
VSIRVVWSLTLMLCVLPERGFAALYVAPSTAALPLQFTYGSLSAGVSFTDSDPALFSDPKYAQLWQTHDVVAFTLGFTPGSDNLYTVDAYYSGVTIPVSGASFVAGGPNAPTNSVPSDTVHGVWVLPHPVTREADGAYQTSTLLLVTPLGSVAQSPTTPRLAVMCSMYSGASWGFSMFSELSPAVPEPPLAALALPALAALALARRPTLRRASV